MFIRNIFKGRISSSFLLQSFSLCVPSRVTRQQTSVLLNVPFARVSTVKEGLFGRLPRQLNRFLGRHPTVDMFNSSFYHFRRSVKLYAASVWSCAHVNQLLLCRIRTSHSAFTFYFCSTLNYHRHSCISICTVLLCFTVRVCFFRVGLCCMRVWFYELTSSFNGNSVDDLGK